MTFREFKENIISSLKEKVAIALEAKKQEVASSMFEAKDDGEEYREFFRSALKKFGVKSPDELEGKKKKEFYDYVDKNWTSDKEEAGIDEGNSKFANPGEIQSRIKAASEVVKTFKASKGKESLESIIEKAAKKYNISTESILRVLEVRNESIDYSMFNEAKKYADGDWVVYDDYTGKVVKTFTGNNAGKEAVKFQKKEFSKGKNYVARLKSDYPYNESTGLNEGGRVYDPLTKKMVNRKSIKQQAGGPVTRNGKEVKDVGMSKHWLQKMLKKGDYVTCNKSGESGQIQNISGDKETIDIKWSKGGTSSRPINAVRPVMESTDLNEGMGAFKAAAEVLKAFGGKKPAKMSDMMKFDSEIEKAAKKYDVSVDDILKVINK